MARITGRKTGRRVYLWLLIGLLVLLALGVLLLVAGIQTGSPPFPQSSVSI